MKLTSFLVFPGVVWPKVLGRDHTIIVPKQGTAHFNVWWHPDRHMVGGG